MTACRQPGIKKHDLKTKIDSLQLVINNSYKPGTGEIMSNIVQPHHYKLWLAGKTGNWELAKYESHMIAGGFKRIQKYHPGTPEANASAMIYPQLEAINKAIEEKDALSFDKDFRAITQTCNTSHQVTKYRLT